MLGLVVWLFFGIVRPYKGLIYLREKIHGIYLIVAGEFCENNESYQRKIDKWG